MIDWNYMLSQIATVAFDILYFGAIIGTIVIIILDNRNPVKTMAWILILLFLPIVGLVFIFLWAESTSRTYHWAKKLRPLIEETNGRISRTGLFGRSL